MSAEAARLWDEFNAAVEDDDWGRAGLAFAAAMGLAPEGVRLDDAHVETQIKRLAATVKGNFLR